MTADPHAPAPAAVTIRPLGPADAKAAERLAQLDSAVVPDGPLLGAEVEGTLLAMVPLAGGAVIADPFSRTAELRSLLELRAAQLRAPARARRRPSLRFRGHTRAALPSSPPGAGGRLLTLPARPL